MSTDDEYGWVDIHPELMLNVLRLSHLRPGETIVCSSDPIPSTATVKRATVTVSGTIRLLMEGVESRQYAPMYCVTTTGVSGGTNGKT